MLKRLQPFLISASIHAGLLGAFVFKVTMTLPSVVPRLVTTLRMTIKAPRVQSPIVREDGHHLGLRSPRVFPLSRLGVAFNLDPRRPAKTSPRVEIMSEARPSHLGLNLAAEGRSAGALQRLYQRINEQFVYPSEFQAAQIEGTADARLVFNKIGQLDWDLSRVEGSSGYLRVLVARLLRNAFREPIAEAAMITHLDCNFRLEITEFESDYQKSQRQAKLGTQFSFYRGFRRSLLSWKLGPLSGWGPAAGVDLLWFPRTIGKLLSKKAEIDPLNRYRDDPAW